MHSYKQITQQCVIHTHFCSCLQIFNSRHQGVNYHLLLLHIWIGLHLFICILCFWFVLQRSADVPVFCIVWVSSECLHVIWARTLPKSMSHILVISGSVTVSVNLPSRLVFWDSRCYLICIIINSPVLCRSLVFLFFTNIMFPILTILLTGNLD